MSADNGVYILVLRDQIRVTEAQAIDNIYWWFNREYELELGEGTINPLGIIRYFQKARIFKSDEDAMRHAFNIARDISYLEYGISEITHLSSYTWQDVLCLAKYAADRELEALEDRVKWDKRWDSERRWLRRFVITPRPVGAGITREETYGEQLGSRK
jgi:hypothetical protein